MNAMWDDLIRRLDRYSCTCGSGGSMACEDDCAGDRSDSEAREALRHIIAYIKTIETDQRPGQKPQS